MGLWLMIRVWLVRLLLNINDRLERRQLPVPSGKQHTIRIVSPSKRGYVLLHFYQQTGQVSDTQTKKPVVIDIHGGGYSSGRPAMDDRFIDQVLALPSKPIVVAVQYSLCPEAPYPSGVQDVAAAIEWMSSNEAERYNIDASRLVVVGFSAGGGLALTSSLWLKEQQRVLHHPLRGVISIYANLDSRSARQPSKSALLNFLYSVWDESFTRRSPVDSAFVSPAAASDEQLQQCLPERIGLYPVADDPYVRPTEAFRERLIGLGKQVSGFVEPDAAHAWDKRPVKSDTLLWQKRQAWFTKIVEDIESMLSV